MRQDIFIYFIKFLNYCLDYPFVQCINVILGKMITDIIPAPTRSAAILGYIVPLLTAKSVNTITSGN